MSRTRLSVGAIVAQESELRKKAPVLGGEPGRVGRKSGWGLGGTRKRQAHRRRGIWLADWCPRCNIFDLLHMLRPKGELLPLKRVRVPLSDSPAPINHSARVPVVDPTVNPDRAVFGRGSYRFCCHLPHNPFRGRAQPSPSSLLALGGVLVPKALRVAHTVSVELSPAIHPLAAANLPPPGKAP